MPPSKVKPETTYEAFHSDTNLCAVAESFKVHHHTLRRWWTSHFGEEAVAVRDARLEALAVKPEDTYETFYTEEPFKAVSARVGVSPNLLRSWWVAKFGKEAVNARGKAIQSKVSSEAGHSRKGIKHNIQDVIESCSSCGALVTVNLLQKARSKTILCIPCEERSRGVDRHCPVCGFGCAGEKGLASHIYRPQHEHEAHALYLMGVSQKDPWEGKEEGQDFVRCLLCSYRGVRIDPHLRAEHSLTTEQYRDQFPGAKVQADSLLGPRIKNLVSYNQVHPQKGLKKTISCPSCAKQHEVAWSLASMHDFRCLKCKVREKALEEVAKWADKVEGLDYVVCQVCGYKAENLTSHIYNAHPELEGEYLSIFSDSEVVSELSAVRDKTALKGRILSDETKAKMSENAGRWNKGLTKENHPSIALISEHMKGRPAWSKGLTKEDHPSLKRTSEALSIIHKGQPSPNKANLTDVDFTPYLDEAGAVDRKSMAEALDLDEVTITKYMKELGLRLSTKYVDARVERQIIHVGKEDLLRYTLQNGKVIIARAMVGLGCDYRVIKREAARHGLEVFTHRIRQILCLEAISKALGGASYEQEWTAPNFINPPSGHRFRFDGFFPTHNLIVEFHGYQHWTFPSFYIRQEEVYCALQERDRIKENLILSDPVLRYFLVREDEPYVDVAYLRGRLIDEGIFDPGK